MLWNVEIMIGYMRNITKPNDMHDEKSDDDSEFNNALSCEIEATRCHHLNLKTLLCIIFVIYILHRSMDLIIIVIIILFQVIVIILLISNI